MIARRCSHSLDFAAMAERSAARCHSGAPRSGEPGIYNRRLGLWIVSLVRLAYEVCEAGIARFMERSARPSESCIPPRLIEGAGHPDGSQCWPHV